MWLIVLVTSVRERRTQQLEEGLRQIGGISLLPRDPRITRQASYHYVFKFHSEIWSGVHRNAFVAALNAEGVHSDGRFYEAVYKSSLFQFAAQPWRPLLQPEPNPPRADRPGLQVTWESRDR